MVHLVRVISLHKIPAINGKNKKNRKRDCFKDYILVSSLFFLGLIMKNIFCYRIYKSTIGLFVFALIVPQLLSKSNAQSTTTVIQEVIIKGQVHPDDQYTYRLEEFQVPESTGALQIEFDYTGKYTHTEIEIGLYDPDGFRGTSRFSKSSFYISN